MSVVWFDVSCTEPHWCKVTRKCSRLSRAHISYSVPSSYLSSGDWLHCTVLSCGLSQGIAPCFSLLPNYHFQIEDFSFCSIVGIGRKKNLELDQFAQSEDALPDLHHVPPVAVIRLLYHLYWFNLPCTGECHCKKQTSEYVPQGCLMFADTCSWARL